MRGTVPEGNYVGVRWTVGVPFALNHTDAAATPAPLNSAAMAWSWQVGRKFTKIEFSDPGGADRHAGRRRRSTCISAAPAAKATRPPGRPSSAAAPNRPAVRLKKFDPAKQQVAVDVQGDAGRHRRHGQPVAARRAACPSRPTPSARGVFRAFGIDWKADGTGTGKSPTGTTQTVFKAIER